jgi:hypothetical protein
VKRESIFSKILTRDAGGRARARDGPSRLCISLSHLRSSASHRCISLSQQRDSCSCTREQLIHEKVVPLSEKPYHFCKSPTTFPPLQLSHHWDSLSRHWDSLSHHSLQLSRQGLTGSVPVSPEDTRKIRIWEIAVCFPDSYDSSLTTITGMRSGKQTIRPVG